MFILHLIFMCEILALRDIEIQMRALAIIHLKYWFRISSILERTKNSTKTNNTSFERSDSRLFKSWRLGAWHSYWPATPTLYDKLNFLGKGGVASPWCCQAPVLQEYFCPLSGLSNVQFIINSGCGKPIIMPCLQSSGFKKTTDRPFKWGITCFCTFLGSL